MTYLESLTKSVIRTLKVFRNGTPSEYTGPRKADGIISYMIKSVILFLFPSLASDIQLIDPDSLSPQCLKSPLQTCLNFKKLTNSSPLPTCLHLPLLPLRNSARLLTNTATIIYSVQR